MNEAVLIGIDAGTSVIKSVAFNTAGKQLAAAAIPNSYETLPGGGVEQDMARTWRDAAETLRLLADKVPNLAARTVAGTVSVVTVPLGGRAARTVNVPNLPSSETRVVVNLYDFVP